MDQVAVLVDAGYLFAAGSILLTGERPPLPRRELNFDQETVVGALTEFATQLAGLPLLYIYWYDGAWGGKTPQHRALESSPKIKLRLGRVNRSHEQKGVDALIVSDLINLARDHEMAEAVLLSGDEDLREGVQQAQKFGVRVHLLGIESAGEKNQSSYLVQDADTLHQWKKLDVAKFLSVRFDVPRTKDLPEGSDPFKVVAEAIAAQLSQNEVNAIVSTTTEQRWSGQIDAALLTYTSRILGKLEVLDDDRVQIRSAFMAACRRLATLPPSSSQPETRPFSVLELLSRPSGRSFEEFGDDVKLAAENAASANDAYDAAVRAFKDKYEEPTPEEDPEDLYADEALEAGREAYDAYISKHGNEGPHKP